ncbi:MAG TPA: flagellar biosynthetic protein FliO [Rhabdochlamydiaceae bacterium]
MAPMDPNAAPDTTPGDASGAVPELPSAVPSVSPLDMVPGYEGAFLKMFLALIALIVGIFFTVWLLKKLSQGRWAGGNSNRAIKIIEKRPLSPKTMLYIIDVDGQQSVIAESQLEIKHLMNLEEFKDTESPT